MLFIVALFIIIRNRKEQKELNMKLKINPLPRNNI